MRTKTKLRAQRRLAAEQRGVSQLEPLIADSTFCSHCLRDGLKLTPWRERGTPAAYATPKYCPTCLPKGTKGLNGYVDAAKWAQFANEHNEMVHLMRGYHETRKLFRTELLPEQFRLPTFVWDVPNPIVTLVHEIRRGMRFMESRL